MQEAGIRVLWKGLALKYSLYWLGEKKNFKKIQVKDSEIRKEVLRKENKNFAFKKNIIKTLKKRKKNPVEFFQFWMDSLAQEGASKPLKMFLTTTCILAETKPIFCHTEQWGNCTWACTNPLPDTSRM